MAQGLRTFTVEYIGNTAPKLPQIRRLVLTTNRGHAASIPRLSLRASDAAPQK